ncbi:hypothetical protein GUJ93_ZPchr0002g23292 [Zizania palustris]|uniref:Uncharacterized protein n=1 Tax=Zizania palustris TaxID=103762 RepID=A0A8J5VFS2_ZIZPA|nr:hypothetical protein GUJ93_ZPchr0002g23292 [Zizania palustris]
MSMSGCERELPRRLSSFRTGNELASLFSTLRSDVKSLLLRCIDRTQYFNETSTHQPSATTYNGSNLAFLKEQTQ